MPSVQIEQCLFWESNVNRFNEAIATFILLWYNYACFSSWRVQLLPTPGTKGWNSHPQVHFCVYLVGRKDWGHHLIFLLWSRRGERHTGLSSFPLQNTLPLRGGSFLSPLSGKIKKVFVPPHIHSQLPRCSGSLGCWLLAGFLGRKSVHLRVWFSLLFFSWMNPPNLQNNMISAPQLCRRQVSQVFIAIDHSIRFFLLQH